MKWVFKRKLQKLKSEDDLEGWKRPYPIMTRLSTISIENVKMKSSDEQCAHEITKWKLKNKKMISTKWTRRWTYKEIFMVSKTNIISDRRRVKWMDQSRTLLRPEDKVFTNKMRARRNTQRQAPNKENKPVKVSTKEVDEVYKELKWNKKS